jgi:hypothetical protein
MQFDCQSGNRAAKIMQGALGIESNEVAISEDLAG